MTFNNRNNLPNDNAPWGREVEQKVDRLERDLHQLRTTSDNQFKALQGTLQQVASQQNTLLQQQAELRNGVELKYNGAVRDGTTPSGTEFFELESSFFAPSWATQALIMVTNSVGGDAFDADVFAWCHSRIFMNAVEIGETIGVRSETIPGTDYIPVGSSTFPLNIPVNGGASLSVTTFCRYFSSSQNTEAGAAAFDTSILIFWRAS